MSCIFTCAIDVRLTKIEISDFIAKSKEKIITDIKVLLYTHDAPILYYIFGDNF